MSDQDLCTEKEWSAMSIALSETKSAYIAFGFDPKSPALKSKVPSTDKNPKSFLWQQKIKNKQKTYWP